MGPRNIRSIALVFLGALADRRRAIAGRLTMMINQPKGFYRSAESECVYLGVRVKKLDFEVIFVNMRSVPYQLILSRLGDLPVFLFVDVDYSGLHGWLSVERYAKSDRSELNP